ncbi:hypothetical protein GLW03_12920 [Halobacillus halophilus]|uniref:hypothetical protein n=1 Tax=Halobacillus halophilus TaxID=1570 RepID=UPI001369630B|nr:hypothetical protein [Halobacillus halophilus]MYL30728.1 hypothetical protein [Halobacillus halophilus]
MLENEIHTYIEAMQERQHSINQLEGDRFLESHKKTLLFSLIETMGKGVYGNKFPSKATTFEKFILSFCEWEHAERVSIQQLALLLELDESSKFNYMRDKVFKELRELSESSPLPFSHDYTIEQVKSLMPKGEPKIAGVDFYTLKHVHLLWKNRNTLVHEGRTKDMARRSDLEEYPHYLHFTRWTKNLEVEYEVLKICYPVNFFNSLVDTALVNIRQYLIEKEINPRGNYDFGELWVRPRRRSDL